MDMDVEKVLKLLAEKEAELSEFQESSRELELELQTQLELSEKRNQDLIAANSRLRRENEDLKSKFIRERNDLTAKVEQLTQDLTTEKSRNKSLADSMRSLEQMNDDLERSKRALAATLDDFESKFNSQIEKNVLLESELGEMSQLEGLIQRLKDEARELREELMVQQTKRISISADCSPQSPPSSHTSDHPLPASSPVRRPVIHKPNSIPVRNAFSPSLSQQNHLNHHSSRYNNNILTSLSKSPHSSPPSTTASSPASGLQNNKSPVSSPVRSVPGSVTNGGFKTPTSRSSSGVMTNGTSHSNGHLVREPLPLLSPGTRSSALTIVSDLLREVGDLISKLASCRNTVRQACPHASVLKESEV